MDEQYGIKVKVDGLDQIDKLDKAASKLDKSLAGLGGDVRNIQKSRRELAETAARARQVGLVAAESAAKMSQANTAAAKAIAGLAANSKAAGKALQNSESAASRLMAALAGRDTAEKFSNELRQIRLGAEASSGSLDKLTAKMAAYKRMAESLNRTRIEPPAVVRFAGQFLFQLRRKICVYPDTRRQIRVPRQAAGIRRRLGRKHEAECAGC